VRGSAALLLLAAVTTAGELQLAEQDIQRTIERTRPSVVLVVTPNDKDLDQSGVALGSGEVILTVRSTLMLGGGALPETVPVRFPGTNKSADAERIADDAETDTVLYRVRGAKTRAINVGRSADVQLGSWVLLIGNAFGAGHESQATASLGNVSGLVRDSDGVAAIHTSALVNPGSIGAPVIDLTGDLLGITANAITEGGEQSIVIPYDRVRARYKAMGGEAARVVGLEPPARQPRPTVTDQFGIVMEAAVERAHGALVGVRRRDPSPGAAPAPEPPPAQEAQRRPQPPRPVPGKRPALDRSSGLIVGADGWIVCPLRVTGWPGPIHNIDVDLLDGRTFPAEVRGYDERLRVALLKIEAAGLPVLEEQPSRTVRSGQFAVALGYPHGDPDRGSPQVTIGIVSRTGALKDLHPSFDAVQTDAGVAGGNRGGPLVDAEGRLIGMLLDVNDTDMMGYVTRLSGSYGGNAGLGFALPMPVIRALLPRLQQGVVFRPVFLGVATEVTPDGLVVREVVPKNSEGQPTPAEAAGLRPGDRLVSIAGSALRSMQDLLEALAAYTVGDEVELAVEREGSRFTVRVSLVTR